jgi:predicted nucleic acid-binding protein
MKVVLDANVIISALIADSKTRELIVTLEPELLTPEIVREEIDTYEGTQPTGRVPLPPRVRQ